MSETENEPNSSAEDPQTSITESLGIENATPLEEVVLASGLNRLATQLLVQKLSDSIPKDEREHLDAALEKDDLGGMIDILCARFPDYDELQQQAVEDARQWVLNKAAAIEKRLPAADAETSPEETN